MPACLEKYNGTNLKTVPFPIPTVTPTASAPTVYQIISGEKDNRMPEKATPIKTNIKIINGLNLSASNPPTGRSRVAIIINTYFIVWL